MSDESPTDDDLQDQIETAQEAHRQMEAYDGDEYFIRNWVDENTSLNEAIAELSDPFTLLVLLHMNGLETILSDKYATAGLRKLLIQRHPGILAELVRYAKRQKAKKKPGPKPTDGKYIYEKIMELDAQGKSNGKIAKMIYNDPSKANLVAAHLNQARLKIKTEPAQGS